MPGGNYGADRVGAGMGIGTIDTKQQQLESKKSNQIIAISIASGLLVATLSVGKWVQDYRDEGTDIISGTHTLTLYEATHHPSGEVHQDYFPHTPRDILGISTNEDGEKYVSGVSFERVEPEQTKQITDPSAQTIRSLRISTGMVSIIYGMAGVMVALAGQTAYHIYRTNKRVKAKR